MWRSRARKRPPPKKRTTTEAGYGGAWPRLAKAYRAAHPMCCHCELVDPITARRADCVDHITPHAGDEQLRLDPTNWQALCHWHHTQKTWRERAGWVITWRQNPELWVVSGKPRTGKRQLAARNQDIEVHVIGSMPRGFAYARRHKATWHVLSPMPEDWALK